MNIEGSFEMDAAVKMPAVQLLMIPKEHVGRVLPMVIDKLHDVAQRSRGRFTVPGMLENFGSGRWQMWIIWDASSEQPKAVFGTEIYRDVGEMWICGVRFLSGDDSGQWLYLIDQLEAWARANGCARLDMLARKGWARKLPDYKMTHVLLEKDL